MHHKIIVVGFSTRRTLLSFLIRWITASDVSHVYFRKTFDDINELVVCHATAFGVQAIHYDRFLTKNKVIAEFAIKCPIRRDANAGRFLIQQLGKPYGFLTLLGFGITALLKMFGIKSKNIFSDGGYSYVCSELVAKYMGLSDAESFTPQDLYEIMESLGEKIYSNE